MNLPIAILFRAFLSSNTTALRNFTPGCGATKNLQYCAELEPIFQTLTIQHVEQRP
jgi:hypothetical protein